MNNFTLTKKSGEGQGILPHNFEKALQSSDPLVREVYQLWRKRDFPNSVTSEELRVTHNKLFPFLANNEWLDIFPRAKDYIKEKLVELKGDKERLEARMEVELRRLYQTELKGFELWFGEAMVNVWFMQPLEALTKQITKLKWQLYPPKQKAGQITDAMVQRARDYPFESLVGLNKKKGWVLCPFHNDTKPSFYIAKNYGYCFSCGKQTDTIQFLIETKGLSFRDAVEALQ